MYSVKSKDKGSGAYLVKKGIDLRWRNLQRSTDLVRTAREVTAGTEMKRSELKSENKEDKEYLYPEKK